MSNAKFAARQADKHLECRNLRHAWEISKFRAVTQAEATTFKLLKWKQAIVRELRCIRCECVRLEFFGRDAQTLGWVRVKGNYEYPKGYLFDGKKEDARPDRWDYFTELLDRVK